MSKQNRNSPAKSSDTKSGVEVIVARYGLVSSIMVAILSMLGVIIAAYVSYIGTQTQVFVPLNATQTAEAKILLTPSATNSPIPTVTPTIQPTPTQNIIEITPAKFDSGDLVVPAPTIGAQLNFSPESSVDSGWFRRSPFDGVFMSEAYDYRYAPSWYAYYKGQPRIPAESAICLMNMGAKRGNFIGADSGPLNIKASRINIVFSIYSDYRYTLEVKDIDVLIADFVPMKTDIQLVEVGLPGAGGFSYPFKNVQGMKVWVNGVSNTVYKMDFRDFVLAPNNGVNVIVPIAMANPGKYKFIFKVNGVATPTYAGDPAGAISLTSNVLEYEWILLNDPRDYQITELTDMTGAVVPVELRPCP